VADFHFSDLAIHCCGKTTDGLVVFGSAEGTITTVAGGSPMRACAFAEQGRSPSSENLLNLFNCDETSILVCPSAAS
jgi:hypothetical protein